ncbi:MAG: hypothetical protein P8X96_08055 [Desulfobacteraceae bacterium]
MPWLPIYIDKIDLKMLIDWINAEKNIAFIEGNGPKKWKAVNSIERYEDKRHCLWHCESGPLPLLRKRLPDGKILDPFKGWKERRTGADSSTPYFGAGHPGVYWLNARTESTYKSGFLGLSSFEWIGNWYKGIGIVAHPATKKWWDRLRRWVKKQAVRIPRDGEWNGNNPEIYAFPSALDKIKRGEKRDNNP